MIDWIIILIFVILYTTMCFLAGVAVIGYNLSPRVKTFYILFWPISLIVFGCYISYIALCLLSKWLYTTVVKNEEMS